MRTSSSDRPPAPGRRDSAGGIAPPPLLYGVAIIVGVALHVLHPLAIASRAEGVLHVVGIALVIDSWWLLILLPLVLLIVQLGVIRREERYLEAKFGGAYHDYMTRVRRWL